VESFSVLDAAAAAAGVASGHPIIAAIPVTRPWIRNRVLSPSYQRGMISGTPAPAPLSMFAQPGLFAVTPAQNAAQTLGAQ
jgi:hypothetical protein